MENGRLKRKLPSFALALSSFFSFTSSPSSSSYSSHYTPHTLHTIQPGYKSRMESKLTEVSPSPGLTNLSPEKLQPLEAALTLILAMPIARDTYAQIINGTNGRDHPSPSNEAIQQYEEIRKGFTVRALKIDTKVL